ncbi:MAG TPA: hypothetical protein PLG50_03020 [bacterium]|nr:hypothetical protein [bacterium]HQG44617.1 hypothetical protein [bacterium]HQI48698.1 hypothetical protein [bacterium]HQJ65047.1 hypothetical protein [bacterium]
MRHFVDPLLMVLGLLLSLLAGRALGEERGPAGAVGGGLAAPCPSAFAAPLSRPDERPADTSGRTAQRVPHRDFWLGKDKADHLVVSGVLVGFAYYAARRELHLSDPRSKNLAAGFSLSMGLVKELRDQRRPGNFFSLKDLAADGVGMVLGYFLCSAGGH